MSTAVFLRTIFLLFFNIVFAQFQQSLPSFRSFTFNVSSGMNFINDGVTMFNQFAFSERDRRQCVIFEGRDNMFPCKYLKPSKKRPSSVHKLTPGDIKVVAAIGDSLTAAAGALSRNFLQLTHEHRGVSFSVGGRGTWQQFITLPNIIKNFNPHLLGMSYVTTKAYTFTVDGYNMALSGAKSFNISDQAFHVIAKMKGDPKINFEKDWKMVTILIGHNDLCSIVCTRSEFEVDTEVNNVVQVLDYLYRELPRTFVNLMPMADVSHYFDLKRLPTGCLIIRKWLCPCLFNPFQRNRFDQKKSKAWTDLFNRKLDAILATGRYNKRKDFTVVFQPTLMRGTLPQKNGIPDLDYLAPDCFHFAQKTHALLARGLWNNLLQPIGQKSLTYEAVEAPFLCPSKERPYLATFANSNNVQSELKSNMEDFRSLMGTNIARNSRCRL